VKTLPLLLSLALLLSPAAGLAQTIIGTAVEESTQRPIVGALVELAEPGGDRITATLTDSVGRFVLAPRRGGRFVVRLSHLAFVQIDSASLSVRAGERVEIELRMDTRAIPLEPLVVKARSDPRMSGFHERAQRNGFGRYLTRADIEARRGVHVTELLRTMPGVYLVPARSRVGTLPGNVITMRGGADRCMPTVYIDGAVMQQFLDTPIDAFLMSDMVEGIEVYRGMSAPSPFVSRSGCGVVAFWTRRAEGRPLTWRRVLATGGVLGAMLLLMLR
jgi:hypothetical protein